MISEKFLLVYTNQQRFAHSISKSKKKNIPSTIKCYEKIKSLNNDIVKSLRNFDYVKLAKLFNSHWNFKKNIGGKITNSKINNMYEYLIRKCGCLGGKLIGAGGGGFLMFYGSKSVQIKLKKKFKKLTFLKFKFENEGSQIILNK